MLRGYKPCKVAGDKTFSERAVSLQAADKVLLVQQDEWSRARVDRDKTDYCFLKMANSGAEMLTHEHSHGPTT